MQKRLLDYLETEKKLSKFQAACRKGYGTNDHIFSLRSLINKYVFASKEKLYACFVDFVDFVDSEEHSLVYGEKPCYLKHYV